MNVNLKTIRICSYGVGETILKAFEGMRYNVARNIAIGMPRWAYGQTAQVVDVNPDYVVVKAPLFSNGTFFVPWCLISELEDYDAEE